MNILLVTYYKYPEGDAGSIRTHIFAKMLQDMGHTVCIVGSGKSTDFKIQTHHDVPYISMRYQKFPRMQYIDRCMSYILFYYNLRKFILNPQHLWHAVLMNDINFFALQALKKYAKKYDLQLLHDSVEWYSPEQFSNGIYDLQYIKKNNLNTKWIDQQFKVVAISHYLEDHFLSRGIKTCRIPVLFDKEEMIMEKQTKADKMVCVYAGAPGKKDCLDKIIEAFLSLPQTEKPKIELHVLGITENQMMSLCNIAEMDILALNEMVICFGRLSHEDVLKQLQSADFTVLLRSETQRYAKAGFPTKVVESLASGTPIICNITSDLGLYLKDEENAIIVKENSGKAFYDALIRALKTTQEKRKDMCIAARKTAEDFFDYRLYESTLERLIKK